MARLPLAVATMEVGMLAAVVLSAAVAVGLTQTGVATVVLALGMEAAVVTVVLALTMEAAVVTAELVAKLMRRQLHRFASLLPCVCNPM